MRLRFLVCLAGISLGLASCDSADKAPTTNPVTQAAPIPAEQPAEAPATHPADATIWFEPAALSKCAKREKVAVHWDASRLPDVKVIGVHPVNGDKEALFARTRPVGTKMTGPWANSGLTMVLRNEDSGAEIGRATIGELPCTK